MELVEALINRFGLLVHRAFERHTCLLNLGFDVIEDRPPGLLGDAACLPEEGRLNLVHGLEGLCQGRRNRVELLYLRERRLEVLIASEASLLGALHA